MQKIYSKNRLEMNNCDYEAASESWELFYYNILCNQIDEMKLTGNDKLEPVIYNGLVKKLHKLENKVIPNVISDDQLNAYWG